jgi:hypothetical protein
MSSPTYSTPPGQDTTRQPAAQIINTTRRIGSQLRGNAPQLATTAQQAQRVIQDYPGAAVTMLAGLGIGMLRRRSRHRRKKARQTQRGHRGPRTHRARRWARALAVVGWLIRRRRHNEKS